MSNRGINHEYALNQIREAVISEIVDIMSKHKQERQAMDDKRFILFEPREVNDHVVQFDDFAYNYNKMQRLPTIYRLQNSLMRTIGFPVISIQMTRADELIFNTKAMEKEMWDQPFTTEDVDTDTLVKILIEMEEKKS